jgi:UDPglucose 6-dehydrogenase
MLETAFLVIGLCIGADLQYWKKTALQILENATSDKIIVEKGKVQFIEDAYEATAGSHAIAILTEWRQYRDLDYERIYRSMEKPAFIFDGRNVVDHQALYELGFNVYPIGKAALTHL